MFRIQFNRLAGNDSEQHSIRKNFNSSYSSIIGQKYFKIEPETNGFVALTIRGEALRKNASDCLARPGPRMGMEP